MGLKMKLSDTFWKEFEVDLQDSKTSYLDWALTQAQEPGKGFRHMFLWNHQREFCIVNSRYGRAFAISPFGLGVRSVPRSKVAGIPPGLDETDLELLNRLTANTHIIRKAIQSFLNKRKVKEARNAILNYYWLKLGPHELLFDRIQYGEDERGKIVKGRINVEEPEDWKTPTPDCRYHHRTIPINWIP